MRDCCVELRQLRPVQTRFDVMRGVIAEITRQNIVPAVHDIVGGLVGVVGIQAAVVIVGRPAGTHESAYHGDDEQDQRIHPIDHREHAQESEHEDAAAQESTLELRVLSADFVRAPVSGDGDGQRVANHSHGSTFAILPRRFVLRLVEVVHMVAKIVMEHPGIRRNSGL